MNVRDARICARRRSKRRRTSDQTPSGTYRVPSMSCLRICSGYTENARISMDTYPGRHFRDYHLLLDEHTDENLRNHR